MAPALVLKPIICEVNIYHGHVKGGEGLGVLVGQNEAGLVTELAVLQRQLLESHAARQQMLEAVDAHADHAEVQVLKKQIAFNLELTRPCK